MPDMHLIEQMDDLVVPLAVVDAVLAQIIGDKPMVYPALYLPPFSEVCMGMRIEQLVKARYEPELSGLRIIPWQLTKNTPLSYRFFERDRTAVVKRGEVYPEQDPVQAAFDRFVNELSYELTNWLRRPLIVGALQCTAVAITAPFMKRVMTSWYVDPDKPRLVPGLALPERGELVRLLATRLPLPFKRISAYDQGGVELTADGNEFRFVVRGERYDERVERFTEREAAYMALFTYLTR